MFNDIKRAVTAIAAISSMGAPMGAKRQRPLWGDGLTDQPLNLLWSACGWDDVATDEYVYFMPFLSLNSARCGSVEQPLEFLKRGVVEHAHDVARALLNGLESGRQPSSSDPVITRLSALAPSLSPAIIARIVLDARIETDRSVPETRFAGLRRAADKPLSSTVIASRLSVLQRVDRLYSDARQCASGWPVKDRAQADLGDALAASIHARFNAAYVYPELAFAHELFTTGAWLGHVLQGRPALMPVAVAETLFDLIDSTKARSDATGSDLVSVLRRHTDPFIDNPAVLKVARRVRAAGYALPFVPAHNYGHYGPDAGSIHLGEIA